MVHSGSHTNKYKVLMLLMIEVIACLLSLAMISVSRIVQVVVSINLMAVRLKTTS